MAVQNPTYVDLDEQKRYMWDTLTSEYTDEIQPGDIAVTGTGVNADAADTSHLTAAGVAGGGFGGWTGIAKVGELFYAQGQDRRSVNITYRGHIDGYTTAVGNSSAGMELTAIIQTSNNNWINEKTIRKTHTDRFGGASYDEPWDTSIDITLYPNTWYRVWVKLRAYIDVQGLGECGSDFGPQDGDDFGESVHVYSIDLLPHSE